MHSFKILYFTKYTRLLPSTSPVYTLIYKRLSRPTQTIPDKREYMNWVTVKKFSDLCGYSEDAIRAKIKKGHWLIDRHFKKAPDGRIFIGIKEVQKWITN